MQLITHCKCDLLSINHTDEDEPIHELEAKFNILFLHIYAQQIVHESSEEKEI